MRSLCYQIFSTVAKTPDDAAASRHIDELVASAKADEQLKKQLTPQFVRQELTDDPVKYVRQIQWYRIRTVTLSAQFA
jgi:hypothetical protein